MLKHSTQVIKRIYIYLPDSQIQRRCSLQWADWIWRIGRIGYRTWGAQSSLVWSTWTLYGCPTGIMRLAEILKISQHTKESNW